MRVSPDGIVAIKGFEGFSSVAYPDPGSADGNPWTIGYGSTGPDIVPGMTITEPQAVDRLRADLVKFEKGVESLVTVPLTQGQFDACVSLVYNIGLQAFKNSTLLRKLNRGAYSSVPTEILRWDKNDGKTMPGLTKRRKREVQMWLTE
jgi:lysozyme